MQRKDFILAGVLAAAFLYLMVGPGAMESFIALTHDYPFAMSFIKFGILATIGECIALRITTGVYNRPGFGILPKFIVWGVLGIAIKLAFTIFAAGTPQVLAEIGINLDADRSTWGFGSRFLSAFATSVLNNCFFAPLLMVSHKLADIHIERTGGELGGFFSKPDVAGLFKAVDWNSMWGFVLKKTVPFFWIPAHTVTFMLPGYFQVLFAAVLGIALGVILAFAGLRAQKSGQGSEAVQ